MTSSASATCEIRQWLADPLDEMTKSSIQRLCRARGVRHVAVMPDAHLAENVCNGVVVATTDSIYPDAVGGDIGCGMAALPFAAEAGLVRDEGNAARLLSRLYETVPANRHSAKTAIDRLPDPLRTAVLGDDRLERGKNRDGRVQFGTLGRGNHFLEFQEDGDGRLWLMIHSGSRAMGQLIRAHHLNSASKDHGLSYLDASSDEARSYYADHCWATQYAELNRRRMGERAATLLEDLFGVRADWSGFFQCHHNYVCQERHFGETLWVHRKGALDAADGKLGIIPGSMGTRSYHVCGRGHGPALRSSSHGAGRRLSRSEARRRISVGALAKQMNGVLFDQRMAHRLRDEAPAAYRDIKKVMRAQRELTSIVRELEPILSYKGG